MLVFRLRPCYIRCAVRHHLLIMYTERSLVQNIIVHVTSLCCTQDVHRNVTAEYYGLIS